MNFMSYKKLCFPKPTAKKKLKQSKLDGFLKNPAASRTVKANRSAMLQEFFMGTVGGPTTKGKTKGTKAPDPANSVETSTTSIENGLLESRVIIAITEGRSNARGEVGIAAMDVNSPELILCQLSDDMWYSGTIIKIQMLNPSEVLLPNTFFNAKLSNSKLLAILRSTFPTVDFKETPRKHFHDFEALSRIEKFSANNFDDVKIALENKYYALAACNALLSYVGIAYYLNFAEKSLRVSYESRYAAMTIDMETSKRLELVTPLSVTNERKTCLFTFMDYCMTRIGKRSLRARILEPFADLQMINQCHEAVAELLEKDNYLCTLRMILKKFYQVDRLMKLSLITSLDDNIKASEAMIGLALMLKNCLSTIPMLVDILSALDSTVFVGIRVGLEDTRYQLVLEHIESILYTNDPAQNFPQSNYAQRINAVKPNVDQVLDLSRSFYTKIIEEITTMVRDMSAQYGMSFQLIHNCSKGYQLSLNVNRTMLTFPEELIAVSRKGNKAVFTTEKLNDLNARLKRVVEDIVVTSNRIISDMLMSIRQEIDVVYLLTGIITELDLIQCFVSMSRNSEFVKPSFGQETKIVDAVHPFLEFGRLKSVPVPNQVIATPDHNLFLITGPNMGGKTVYIKMIAVLQVMAQIGCFIPATDAQFRICDKLFSRIGFEDSIDKGISSFGMEVEQMSFILNNVTPNSLVIIDELGRGTNPDEGQRWAWQMCEKLATLKGYQSNGQFYVDDSKHVSKVSRGNSICSTRRPLKAISSPFVYVTTHFLELTSLSEKLFNVVNLYLAAEEDTVDGNIQLTYTHKVQVGINPVKEYGLALARTVKFPRKIVPKAEAILQKIKDQRVSELFSRNGDTSSSGRSEIWTKEKLLYDLYASIATTCRKASSVNPNRTIREELRQILQNFDPKCSQDLKDSIRNSSIEETFHESSFFKLPPIVSNSSVASGSPMRVNDNHADLDDDDVIPETPQIIHSQRSNATKASITSWLTTEEVPTEVDNDKTVISKLSYHSLLRRLAEKSNSSAADKCSFNGHKGFPVLPYVRPLGTNVKEGIAQEENQVSHKLISKTPSLIGSHEIIPKENYTGARSQDIFDSEEFLKDLPCTPNDSRKESMKAGGDNEFLLESQQISQKCIETQRKNKDMSFFDDTIMNNNFEDPWNDNGDNFKFDSPKQLSFTQRFFASQSKECSQKGNILEESDFFQSQKDDSQFHIKNGRKIPCTATSETARPFIDATDFTFGSTYNVDVAKPANNIDNTFQMDSPETRKLEEDVLGIDFDEEFPLTQDHRGDAQISEGCNESFGASSHSSNSNYKFRLGLMGMGDPRGTLPLIPSQLSYTKRESAKPGPHEFIAKYGKIIEDKYRRSQQESQPQCSSTNNTIKNSQNGAQVFLEKYGNKIRERHLFKEPPIKYPIPSHSKDIVPRNLNSSFGLASEQKPAKQDYSEWLGQYCRSRVKSLGVPTMRKRSHNSSIRSARSRMDIESVNKRWDSYYSEYNNQASGNESANYPKRVSFGDKE